MSGTVRVTSFVKPEGATPCCHHGRANTMLSPPPPEARPAGESFHTTWSRIWWRC